jgi:hypothetical protein
MWYGDYDVAVIVYLICVLEWMMLLLFHAILVLELKCLQNYTKKENLPSEFLRQTNRHTWKRNVKVTFLLDIFGS